MHSADYWIQHLNLKPHPEGGFYSETYRSPIHLNPNDLPIGFSGERRLSTSIYFMLRSKDISKMHRLKSDEIWYYHHGSPLKVISIDKEGKKHTRILGSNPDKAEYFYHLIHSGNIFAAEVTEPDSYSIVSCVVTPGFEFEDFEVFEKEDLIQAYPKHSELFEKFG